jgi:hypothetical protein
LNRRYGFPYSHAKNRSTVLMTKLCARVDTGMAACAKSDQILLRVVAGVAAKCLVVHFKIRHGAATLASPTVSTKYVLTCLVVQLGGESQPRVLGSNSVHDAFSRAWATNACCCSAGRNPKQRAIECKSRVSGRSWSARAVTGCLLCACPSSTASLEPNLASQKSRNGRRSKACGSLEKPPDQWHGRNRARNSLESLFRRCLIGRDSSLSDVRLAGSPIANPVESRRVPPDGDSVR